MSRRSPIIQDDLNSDPELEPLVPSDPSCPEKPAPFEFLTENVYYTEALTSRERRKAKRMVCECQFDPEQDDPADACGENCLNRLLMIECGSRCPCGEYCTNKRFQRGGYAQVEVFKTQKKGWGLRSLTNISPGTFVMEYCGEVITPVQFEERKKQYTTEKRRHYYFMSLRSDEILDATQKGNHSRFINHSCSPNCETQKWTVQGKLRIGFFTVRYIMEREEVTFDYQFQRFGDVAQRCYCGSSNCRGYLGQSKQTTPFRTVSTRSLRDIGSPREGGWRRRHTARSENREDSMFEKQIYDIVGSSWRLRNTDQVISISRIMLQAESIGQRVMLLHVLQATEDQACLRKFLSLHGLQLLWSWMVDSPEPESLTVLHFREQLVRKACLSTQVLQALSHLPITTRNQLTDSHLVTMVTRWLKPTTRQPEQVSSITSPAQSSVAASLPQHQQPVVESSMEATVITEADSNMDSEGNKMEEEEGSCDSVGVVTLKSCDSLANSTHSYHPAMDSELDSKWSAVKFASDTSCDIIADSRQPPDQKLVMKPYLNTKEEVGVMEYNKEEVVGSKQEVGVVDTKEEVGVVEYNKEEMVGSKQEVGVMESKEEVGVVEYNKEEVVGSKQEVGVVEYNKEEVVGSKQEVGVVESKQGVGVVENTRSDGCMVDLKPQIEPESGSKQKEGVVKEVGSEKLQVPTTGSSKPNDLKQDAHTVNEALLESEQEEGVVTYPRSESACDSRVYASKSHVLVEDSHVVEEPGSNSEEKEAVVKDAGNVLSFNPDANESHDPGQDSDLLMQPSESKAEEDVNGSAVCMLSPEAVITKNGLASHACAADDPSHKQWAVLCNSDEMVTSCDSREQAASCNVEPASLDKEVRSHDVEVTSQNEDVISNNVEVIPCDKESPEMKTSSHDNEMGSHDVEMTSHDKELQEMTSHDKMDPSHDVEVTSQIESHDLEVASHEQKVEAHDVEVTVHDRKMKSDDVEVTVHDRKMKSDDVEVTPHDEKMESCDNAEMTAHDEKMDVEVAPHDKRIESCDVVMTAHDLQDMKDTPHEESHDVEMIPHDEKIESHDVEDPQCDERIEVKDAQVKSHDFESESKKENTSLPDVQNMSPETQSRDDHMMQEETEMCGSILDHSNNARENSPCLAPHPQTEDEHPVNMGLHSDSAASNDVSVTSTEVQQPAVFMEKSHNSAVESYDSGVKSHDSGVKSHDSGVKSHDSGVKSHDSAVKSHDSVANSNDSVVSSNSDEPITYNAEKSLENEVKHDAKDASCKSEVKSRDAKDESRESEVMSHDAKDESRESEVKSHYAKDESRESEVKSHYAKDESRESEVMSHDAKDESRESEVKSHYAKDESRESEVMSHDAKDESRESEVKSHYAKDESRDSEVKSHDAKDESRENEIKSHDLKAGTHESEVRPHDAEGESYDSKSTSHDREVKSFDNDVKSNSSDSLSGDENEVMSCEAEAKQVGDMADEELLAASSRVVTMATKLLEKWEGLKKVFRIPKRAQSAKKVARPRLDSPQDMSDGGLREEEGRDLAGGRGRTPRGSGKRSGERGSERKRRWDHWNWSPPPPGPPVTRQKDTPPTWSGKRKVLLPKPKNIFPPVTTAIPPSHHHIPSQSTLVTATTASTIGTSTAIPAQSPYVITQNTGTSFTSSTRFPTPVQNTVIVQPGGQTVYVQQQVYQDGCQTTIMPTQYMPPAQPAFMIPPPSLPAQSTALNPPSFPSTVASQPPMQGPPTITQVPQPLPSHPHLPMHTLPSLPPQTPPTGFIRPILSQQLSQMLVAPPTTQSTIPPSSHSLPPPPPIDSGLPHNWRTAKDPQGKTYYYHVITRKSQWTRPTPRDADGSVTMELASSDEEDSSHTVSLRAPHTPAGTPPPITMAAEKYYDTESTDTTPSPYPSPHSQTHIYTSPQFPLRSPHRSPLPSPHTPPLHLPPPSTPPPTHQRSPNFPHLPGPSTPPLSPSLSPTTSPLSPSPCMHLSPSPHPPPEKRAKVTKSKEQKQKETFKHKISKVVTQCLDQHRKPDCKYGRITCSEDFKYLARKLTHGLAEKELQRRHGSTESLVFNDSVKAKVKEYIRQYMKKSGPVYTRSYYAAL